jgi:hypothetical protein
MDDAPPVRAPSGDPAPIELLHSRLESLERIVAAQQAEVRTRRLVVVDETGTERVVTDVGTSFAELRLRIGARRPLDVVLVAAHEPSDPAAGSTAGIEVWLDGDHVGGFTVVVDR